MQIRSSNKFIDLYLFTIGFVIIFILIAFHMHHFRWIALLPVFGLVLWLVVLKHRFPKSVIAEGNILKIKYFQSFTTKYEAFPLSACRFELCMYTRYVKDHKKHHYELAISINNEEKWKLTTLEGFETEDFHALLTYISTKTC